jgi:hypothetical protein
VEITDLSLLRRLRIAGVRLLIGVVIGALLLPVPIIHLFGVFFFLAMAFLAVRRLLTSRVLTHAEGQCPACQAEGNYFVGFGGRGIKFPVQTSCPKCNHHLELWPAASAGTTSWA